MDGADVFFGLSVGGVVTQEMLATMAENPIVLAMANPDPEISWEDAVAARPDVIMATGRSDYPNQVNNVLGFPFVFRGALDVRASTINTEMLHAATRALADLAKEAVPDQIAHAYGVDKLEFGREYIIPKPLDHRVIRRVAVAVAEAAIASSVARKNIDIEEYVRVIGENLGEQRELMRGLVAHARRAGKRIVYPEGEAERIIITAEAVKSEGIAIPVLLGDSRIINDRAKELGISLDGVEIVDPRNSGKVEEYAEELLRIRGHRGLDSKRAVELAQDPLWMGPLMLRLGHADGLVCGVTRRVRKTMSPMLKVIPLKEGVRRACGMTLIFTREECLALADTAVNIEPDEEGLAEIAILAAEGLKQFGIEPVVAMLSFSSYGGTPHPRSDLVRRAVEIARSEAPGLLIDGEMRVDAALDPLVQERYSDCRLGGRKANVLVFPNLESANIGFNLIRTLTKSHVVGPVMLGLEKPAHMLQPHSCGVSDAVHLTAIACADPLQGQVPNPPVNAEGPSLF